MSDAPREERPGTSASPGVMAARVVASLVVTAGFVWLVFAGAGDWGWWRGWFYIGLLTVGQSASALVVKRRDPELLERRASFGEGTKSWDKAVLGLFGVTYLATVVVAAFDAGQGWSPLPGWTLAPGVVLYALGVAFATWAMAVNTHFEKTVRIQTDRNHRVCDDGPYRYVRHPGYVGASLSFPLATPLLLGSGWAFLPGVISTASLVLRTALEDRMLRAELDGYREYAGRTRYRLLPGIW